MQVRKRDGRLEDWDTKKIVAAAKAVTEDAAALAIGDSCVVHFYGQDYVDIEDIQDYVEAELIRADPSAAKKFILYREKKAEARAKRMHPDPHAISDYIHAAKYARNDGEYREDWDSSVLRLKEMHQKTFAYVKDPSFWSQFRASFDMVHQKRVLPSMRSLQFGGPAIEQVHERMFNCSFLHVCSVQSFADTFYLLLAGCGVGFSVQWQHVNQLPELREPKTVVHHDVDDSIYGWAQAIKSLLVGYVEGEYVEFNYRFIRPEGAPLKTSGGKAPGHLPLRRCIETLRGILDNATGRKLRPIECYDIICHIAEAVLSGGVRRSSLMCLFSQDDGEMMYAKHPHNFEHGGKNAQRAMSNNSVVFLRDFVSKDQFLRLMEVNRQNPNGEPGFFFTDDPDYGTNPCGEIGLSPNVGGVGFCNLTEINGSKCSTQEELAEAARAAAFIGTLQAAYTDFYYVDNRTAKQQPLLGVSITGIMDSPEVCLDPLSLESAASEVLKVADQVSELIGVRSPLRCTTVKPSGTASLVLGCVGSGIHPHHARRYFRRVTANKNEDMAQQFRAVNPHMVEEKPDGDLCITFPVEAPPEAKTVKTMSALELFESAMVVKRHWVDPGSKTRLTHNVSLTLTVDDEWEEVFEAVWANRADIAAMSFLPKFSDKGIPYMPREEVVDEVDEQKWQKLLKNYRPVKYRAGDATLASACEGGKCEA